MLVGITIGIATEVGCRGATMFVVEVVVRVAIEYQVTTSCALHLDTCIAVTIHIQSLEDTLATVVEQRILACKADSQPLHVDES